MSSCGHDAVCMLLHKPWLQDMLRGRTPAIHPQDDRTATYVPMHVQVVPTRTKDPATPDPPCLALFAPAKTHARHAASTPRCHTWRAPVTWHEDLRANAQCRHMARTALHHDLLAPLGIALPPFDGRAWKDKTRQRVTVSGRPRAPPSPPITPKAYRLRDGAIRQDHHTPISQHVWLKRIYFIEFSVFSVSRCIDLEDLDDCIH